MRMSIATQAVPFPFTLAVSEAVDLEPRLMFRVLCISPTGHTFNVYKAAFTHEQAKRLVQDGLPQGSRATAVIDLL